MFIYLRQLLIHCRFLPSSPLTFHLLILQETPFKTEQLRYRTVLRAISKKKNSEFLTTSCDLLACNVFKVCVLLLKTY